MLNEEQKQFVKIINTIALEKTRYEVFCDFLLCAAMSFVQVTHFNQDREQKYIDTINKYNETDRSKFPELLALICTSLEKRYHDFLGEVYMDSNFGSSSQGQFFTPYSVCNLCAEAVIDNPDNSRILTVLEPCVGGGAMVIALCEQLRDKGFNYQQNLLVNAMDISINSIYMAIIHFSLIGVPAIVTHGNSLSLETWDVFETPAVGMNLVTERLEAQKKRDKENHYIPEVKKIASSVPEKVLREREYKQLELF